MWGKPLDDPRLRTHPTAVAIRTLYRHIGAIVALRRIVALVRKLVDDLTGLKHRMLDCVVCLLQYKRFACDGQENIRPTKKPRQ